MQPSHLDVSQLAQLDIDPKKLTSNQQEELYLALQQYLLAKARRDVTTFVALHFKSPQHEMYQEWQRHFDEHRRVLLAAPRGCGKSTQITQLRTLWELGNDPSLRFKIICVSQTRSMRFTGEIGKHIKSCPVCQAVFPGLRPDPTRSWTNTQLNVLRPGAQDTRDASVEAWGIGSSPEGGRADRLVFDDITSLQTSVAEPKTREQIKEAFKGTWLDIKAGPDTRFWYLCTLWHVADASMEVMRTPGWESFVYAVSEDFERIEDNHGNSFDLPIPSSSGEWTKELLIDEFKTRGAFYFNRSWRNNPVDKSTRLFTEEMFKGTEQKAGAIKYGIAPWDERFKPFRKYTGVDLGIGLGAHNKPSVIFTFGVSDGSGGVPKGTRVVLDIRRGLWKSPETARQIIESYNEFHQDCIKVENNYYQQALIDWINSLEGVQLPIEGHFTGSQKLDPDQGIPLLAAEFERDMWWVPMMDKHPEDCTCSTCSWVKEMINYFPGTSENTDTVMACWLGQRAAKQAEYFTGGFSVIEL